MNHINPIPNDMIIEIIKYLPFKELIQFNLVAKPFAKLIKQINWSHLTLRKLKYLAANYQFTRCKFVIHRIGVYSNMTDDHLLNALVNLSKCSEVTIQYSTIKSLHLKYIAKIPSLTFKYCDFESLGVDDWLLLTNVKSLRLDHSNGVNYSLIPELNVDYLVVGYYSTFRITDDDIKYLCNVPKLSLNRCYHITNRGPKYLTNVMELELEDCNRITSEGIGYLSSAKKLSLSNKLVSDKYLLQHQRAKIINRISSDIMGHAAVMDILIDGRFNSSSYINRITILGSIFTDYWLSLLKNVDTLTLRSCDNITDEGLKYLSHVRKINILYCKQISDKGISYLTGINELEIAGCKRVTFASIPNLPCLAKLTVNLAGIKFGHIQVHLACVKNLVLRSCEKMTDNDLIHLAHLEKLQLTDCVNITNDGLWHLRNIRILKLYGFENITSGGLTQLKHVERIHLDSTNRMSTRDIIY